MFILQQLSRSFEVQPSVLITGGSGFLGINLCRYLSARGYTLRSMDIAPFDYPERGKIDEHQADVRDLQAVERAMRGIDLVVHCAAALPQSTSNDIQSTNVDGTRLLLEAAARNQVARFIFISSTAVYGIPNRYPILESDPMQGVGPYGASKIAGEKLCLEYRRKGLRVPVLRPKSFVGPERLGAFELLYDWAYDGRNFPVLGSGNNRYQLLDVEDLCRVIGAALTADGILVDDIFNVGAKEFGTLRESFQAVLDRAGHGKHVVGIPETPAVLALKLLEQAHLSPLYEWIYRTAAKESYVSIERVENKLSIAPEYSNRAALIRNYDWYVAHRGDYLGKHGVTHRLPWKKGLLGAAKWLF